MTAAHLQPIPSETHVVEEVRNFRRAMSRLYEKAEPYIAPAIVSIFSLVLQRAVMRHELKHMQFEVEVFPGEPGDHGDALYVGDDNPYSE